MALQTNRVIEGDSLQELDSLPDESVHAIVTDPPYGLNFMPQTTNGWDDFEPKEYQEWCEEWATKALRVLKPGGHLLAFSGNRTHHRLFTGVEDAGFVVRDTLTWHYGSGFPKGQDIGRLIDKREGKDEDREVIGQGHSGEDRGTWNDAIDNHEDFGGEYDITAPATDDAEQWDGWSTQLKPSTEFVVMARKPLSEGTIAENVLEHGTAALNIDECRIWADDKAEFPAGVSSDSESVYGSGEGMYAERERPADQNPDGRYPANLLLDDVAAVQLDEQSGTLESGARPAGDYGAVSGGVYGDYNEQNHTERLEYSSGGASRYFYCAKANKSERTLDGRINNAHPTVKPIDLMEWLVKLVTAEDQIVLDPFCGSGTTLRAAKNLNREFVGIEQQAKWCDVARARCGLTPENPEVLTSESQSALSSYGET